MTQLWMHAWTVSITATTGCSRAPGGGARQQRPRAGEGNKSPGPTTGNKSPGLTTGKPKLIPADKRSPARCGQDIARTNNFPATRTRDRPRRGLAHTRWSSFGRPKDLEEPEVPILAARGSPRVALHAYFFARRRGRPAVAAPATRGGGDPALATQAGLRRGAERLGSAQQLLGAGGEPAFGFTA